MIVDPDTAIDGCHFDTRKGVERWSRNLRFADRLGQHRLEVADPGGREIVHARDDGFFDHRGSDVGESLSEAADDGFDLGMLKRLTAQRRTMIREGRWREAPLRARQADRHAENDRA